jgi:hypothetical protein
MIYIITPPNQLRNNTQNLKSVFLAGSIEMGNAEDWQKKFVETAMDILDDLIIYNPRRPDWDSTWEQKSENPHFFQQVTWEIQALEKSDIIFMYFVPGTQSPISLLELGMYLTSNKLIVCCPEGFWRKGNVDVMCNMYSIPLFDNLPNAWNYLKTKLKP